MSIATLIIGLGGTGIQTLRALKRLYGELPPKERVPARFLGIDFDRSAVEAGDWSSKLVELAEDEFLYLNPQSIQDALRNLDRAHGEQPAWENVLEWFPEQVKIPVSEVEANGASQMRVLGRLGFFLHDDAISRAIRGKLHELEAEIDPLRLSEERRVMLVSSIAGGTGAGMMIDVAYLVRRQMGRPKVFAYLLLPEVFLDVDGGGRILQNSYACIRELCHLKDQQIPFQAKYYHLPALDIAPGGEEPFARLFLCASEGFCGTNAIREASFQVAESILGQLQRSIQLKTLSVVANTLSADTPTEQKRRRAHCFSTAGSKFVELKKVERLDEAVFDAAARALRQPAFLAELFNTEISTASRRLIEVLGGDQARPIGSSQESSTETSGKPDDNEKDVERKHIRAWRQRIERDAAAAGDQICEDLRKQLKVIEEKLRSQRPEDLDDAVERLDLFSELLLVDFSEPNYKRKLALLRELTSRDAAESPSSGGDTKPPTLFDSLEKRLREEVRSHVSTAERSLEEKPLERKALLEHLLEDASLFYYPFPQRFSEVLANLREQSNQRSRLASGKEARRGWLRARAPRPISKNLHAKSNLDGLRQALGDATLRTNFEAILRVRAIKELQNTLQQRLGNAEQNLAGEKAWDRISKDELAGPPKIDQLAAPLQEKVRTLLRAHLASLIEDAQQLVAEKDPDVLREQLLELVRVRLRNDYGLNRDRHVLEGRKKEIEQSLREALVRMRQRVFERRTPNVLRKGFVLIMVPEGLEWPGGKLEDLFRFLEGSATQILDSRVQVEAYRGGSRIWIYAEDLFNPPDHIRNIEDYYQAYQAAGFVELYHIDRRFLKLREFRDIRTTTAGFVTNCGNAGCGYNIASLPPETRVCPGCHKPIRSRCGNPNCSQHELHRHPKRYEKTCPSCQGFNHAAWWICCRHGEIPEEIPIDKELCPRCIEEHQRDPIAFERSQIGRRPDLRETVFCPHCEDLHAKDPRHPVFRIPVDLLCFYRDGVNGHDFEDFEAIATRHGLPDKVRCPNCRTLLIPVDHAATRTRCANEERQCPTH